MTTKEFLKRLMHILTEKTHIAFTFKEQGWGEKYSIFSYEHKSLDPNGIYTIHPNVQDNLLCFVHAAFKNKWEIISQQINEFELISRPDVALSDQELEAILLFFEQNVANVLTANTELLQDIVMQAPGTIAETTEGEWSRFNLTKLPWPMINSALKPFLNALDVVSFSLTGKFGEQAMRGDSYTFYVTLPDTYKSVGIDLKPDFELLATQLTNHQLQACLYAYVTPDLAGQNLSYHWSHHDLSIISVHVPKTALEHAFFTKKQDIETNYLDFDSPFKKEKSIPLILIKDIISIHHSKIAAITRIHAISKHKIAAMYNWRERIFEPLVAQGVTFVNKDFKRTLASEELQPYEVKTSTYPAGIDRNRMVYFPINRSIRGQSMDSLSDLINQIFSESLPPSFYLDFYPVHCPNCEMLVALRLPDKAFHYARISDIGMLVTRGFFTITPNNIVFGFNFHQNPQWLLNNTLQKPHFKRTMSAVDALLGIRESAASLGPCVLKVTHLFNDSSSRYQDECQQFAKVLAPSPLWQIAGTCLMFGAFILLVLCILSLAPVITSEAAPFLGVGAATMFACGAVFFRKGYSDKANIAMRNIVTTLVDDIKHTVAASPAA